MRKRYAGENRLKAIRECFREFRGIPSYQKAEVMEERLLSFNQHYCIPPLSSEEDLKEIHNLAQSVTTPEINTTESEIVVKDIASIKDIELEDTPDKVLVGRLGEICRSRMLKHFPVAYAWPSLVTAAGIQVPMSPRPTGLTVGDDDDLTNFYTGLVGPVHSGKSQAIEWGAKLMGIFRTKNYLETKAGSAEGLFDKIRKEQGKSDETLGENVLLNLDEWMHFFNKAGIDRASFATVLTTGFYRRRQSLVVSGRKNIEINCMLSWIGGIVDDQYEECFGSSTIGGLYDRFFHGLCPTGFDFDYRPFEGGPELITPIQVAIDPSVWEVTSDWRRKDSMLGRSIELAVRVAKVCAAIDGRPKLFGKDLEGACKTFAIDQSRIRKFLKPNIGDNPDAAFSNAILSWLDRKVPDGSWVPLREVKRGVSSYRLRLGPGVADRALSNLARLGEIILTNNKKAGARGPAGEYIRRINLSLIHI